MPGVYASRRFRDCRSGLDGEMTVPPHEPERDCAESQSQRTRSGCGWSATQPRSGLGVQSANLGQAKSLPAGEGQGGGQKDRRRPGAESWVRIQWRTTTCTGRLLLQQRFDVRGKFPLELRLDFAVLLGGEEGFGRLEFAGGLEDGLHVGGVGGIENLIE